MEELEKLGLGNIAGGAAEELFGHELKRLLDNIADVNTDAEAKRSVTLEFVFEPYDDRSGAEVVLRVKSKLAAVTGAKGRMFMRRRAGMAEAYPHDPRQMSLLSAPEAGKAQ